MKGYLADFRVSSVARNAGVPTAPLEVDAYTRLLIPMRSPGGAIADASGTGKTVSVVGAPAIIQLPPGSKALVFGGGNYLTLANSADLDFGAGDFTIDLFYKDSGSSDYAMMYDRATTNRCAFYINALSCTVVHGPNVSAAITKPTTLTHIAWTRKDQVSRLFLGGVQFAEDADSYMYSGSEPAYIGTQYPKTYFAKGLMCNYRITKGLARWTRDFTPPARLY